jgi:hypothetical protein
MLTLCPLCTHSQRPSIDQALRAGRDLRALADEFGVRTAALRHRRDEHVVVIPLDRTRRRVSVVS